MRTFIITILPSILVFLMGCDSHLAYLSIMQQAENCMNTRPDSALILLEGMADSIHVYPKETQMYWHLLTIQAKDKQYITHTSDSLINRIVEFYEKHDDKAKRMMAYYYQGRVYRDMNDTPQALKAFQRAEELKVSDKELLTKVYSQMGYLFAYQGLYDEAIKVRRKSIDIYTYMGKENKASFAFRDIARMHKAKGQADSALYYYQRACQSAIADNDQTIYDGILGELGNCYYSWGKADTAKLLLMKVWNSNVRMNKTHIFPYLGHIYEQEQKWDSAIYCYNRAMKTKDLYKQVSALIGLSRIELQSKGNSPKAVEYLIKALSLNDSIHDRIQTEAVAKINSLYNYQHTEAENDRLKLEQEKQKVQITLLLLIALGITLGGTLLFFRQKARRLEEEKAIENFRIEMKDRYERSEAAIHENLMKIEVLKMQLQQALEERDLLKAEQLQVQQKRLQTRNEEIALQQEEARLRIDTLRCTAIYMEFQQAAKTENINLLNEQNAYKWDELREAIDKAYPDFTERIRLLCPSLSDKEAKVCLLTKADITPSGIAIILKSSRQAISNIRARLFKRIADYHQDFTDFDLFIGSF